MTRALSLLALALVAACSPGSGASPSAVPRTASATTIQVSLTDQMRIEPAQMTVPAGQPITFVVKNVGAIQHEFYLGDEQTQAAHEREMTGMPGTTAMPGMTAMPGTTAMPGMTAMPGTTAMPGMGQETPNGFSVDPGQTKQLVFTFSSAGTWLAGCHEPGHYPAGMKATITITP